MFVKRHVLHACFKGQILENLAQTVKGKFVNLSHCHLNKKTSLSLKVEKVRAD